MTPASFIPGRIAGRRRRLRPRWSAEVEGRIGALLCGLIIFVTLLGNVIAPHNPDAVDIGARLQGPSAAHWLGTDELGRDLLSRILAGAARTMPAALAVVAIALVIGGVIGVTAGYAGGWFDNLTMRITDTFLGYPAFLLAIAVVASLGPGLWQAVVALSALWWAGYARLARGQARAMRSHTHVEAARALGASNTRILRRHVIPNIFGPILVKVAIDVALVIESIAALGFIGLGAQPPAPEWGALIAASRNYALDAWWYPVFPGVALMIAVVGFNLLGDAVSKARR
jgi:peptide/nickel transport system permease protein